MDRHGINFLGRAMRSAYRAGLFCGMVALAGVVPSGSNACSDFMLPAFKQQPDPDVPGQEIYDNAVSARTMDFTYNFAWFMETQNSNTEVQSSKSRPIDKVLKWKSRYNLVGFRGAHAFSDPGQYFDGMNEKGLSAALLWLDEAWPKKTDNSGYPGPNSRSDKNLSIKYVVNYILSLCDGVQCAIDLLEPSKKDEQPVVFGEELADMVPLALHLVLHDKDNKTAVVEWYGKSQHVHWDPSANPKKESPGYVRVLTNDPPFPDQVKEVVNTDFIRLTRKNHFKEPDGDLTKSYDFYLPGDSSSGSRFVRLFKLNHYISGDANTYAPHYPMQWFHKQMQPKIWRIQLANHIMARVEEVYGEYPMTDDEILDKVYFHTQFTVIRDHSNINLYLRGVYNSNLRRVNLQSLFASQGQSNYLKQYVDEYPGSAYKLSQFENINGMFQKYLPPQEE